MSEEAAVAETVEETLENDAPAVDESTADQQQEPVEQAEPEAKPEKTFTQEELDRIVQKRLAKESRKAARIAEIEAENRFLREQAEAAKRAQQAPQQEGKPNPEQYEDYESYLDALSDWKVDQKLRAHTEQAQVERQQYEQQRQAQDFEGRKEAKMSEGIEKYDDFVDVVIENPTLRITPVMAEAIVESDIGHDVAYYLGTHPDEAARIAALSPVAQIREVARLEGKVTAPPEPTKAPPPITPSGSRASVDKDPDKMSTDEWLAWRRKQLKR